MAGHKYALAKHTGITRRYNFEVKMQNVTRLCQTKSIVTINGQFPGPKIVTREGDRLEITVINHVKYNVTVHWHGVRQLRSGWADGPAYITQCPIQSGQSYVYNFTITGQRGTLFWHAHISWLRVTLYGPIIILPKHGDFYPFPHPYKEVPIVFGEWWKADTEAVINQAMKTGSAPNLSDAFTINGLPGPLYNCSTKDVFKLKVKPGKTYLLRLINAALNDELFFSIANHTLTVVEVDAIYTKPFKTNIILITPGQTTNVLLTTNNYHPNASFLMAARPYATGPATFDNTTTAAILEYAHDPSLKHKRTKPKLIKPKLPFFNDTSFAAKFTNKLRSLANSKFPANVPKKIDRHFFFTVGLGLLPCPNNQTCQGPNNTMIAAAVNNVSFIQPKIALLQAHFFSQSNGVFTTDFPTKPPFSFNYTGTPPNNLMLNKGTKVVTLPFNTSVELVMQDTSIIGAESHPLHLHGFNFFVVGQGFGNFDSKKDPTKFNLVDPIERNTVGVPSGGWVAIRFRADNPGVWFMHCHLEVHTSWGLKMAWIVSDGNEKNQKLLPPPSDLPTLLDFRDKEGLESPRLIRFVGILWAIWITHNHKVFRQRRATVEGLQAQITLATKQHRVYSGLGSVVSPAVTVHQDGPPGFLLIDLGHASDGHPHTTIRIDGSWDARTSLGSSAWVADPATGGDSYMQGKRVFAHSALQTEIIACHLALSWGIARGLTHILLLTDSTLLIQLLHSVTTKDISVVHLLREIGAMGATFRWCRILKVSRREVSPAHDLARFVRATTHRVAFL
ncbi:hypothetical protein BVRB_7g160170 [Beta vulgaris subsp. vulgaris]|nr:hypothetical protein BVRB_7g160170 [Beta vulgaris subsp. vulgaris]